MLAADTCTGVQRISNKIFEICDITPQQKTLLFCPLSLSQKEEIEIAKGLFLCPIVALLIYETIEI